jgi:HSP20 family molecular chaperone IbpA
MPKKSKPKSTVKDEIRLRSPEDYPRELSRTINDFSRRMDGSFLYPFGFNWLTHAWKPYMFPESRRAFADLIDTGKGYRVHAEVPGIPKEKLKIEVMPRQIRIEGEAQTNIDEKKEGYVRKERTHSKIERTIVFPEEVLPEKAEATIKDGVLEVKVPKKSPTETKVQRVQIK